MRFFAFAVEKRCAKRPTKPKLKFDHLTFRRIMRIGASTITALFISAQLFSAPPARSQDITKVEIRLELNNESLIAAFQKIESKCSFHFMYRYEDVKDIQNLKVTDTKKSIAGFLRGYPGKYRDLTLGRWTAGS